MIKKSYISIFAIILLYYIFYMVSLYANTNIWGDILAPVGSMVSFIIIIIVSVKTDRLDDNFSLIRWLLTAMGCLAWTLGDSLWAVCDFLINKDPEHNFFVSFSYFLASFFFTIAIGTFFISKLHKWNRVQLLLDVLATTCIFHYFLLITFFHNNTYEILRILTSDTISFLSIFCDFFIFNLIVIWFISNRRGALKSVIVSLIAFLIYVITDIFYFYQYFNDSYIPNSIIDGIYIISILFMAFGVFYEKYEIDNNIAVNVSDYSENFGKSYKFVSLFLPPIAEMFIYGFKLFDLVIFASIIIMYLLLCSSIQNAIKNELLLQKEKETTTLLEKKVSERTAELIKLNNVLDRNSKIDAISTLYNRGYFIQELNRMLEDKSQDKYVYVLFIDLDHFRSINDTFGHNVGDAVLLEIANRLNHWKSDGTIIARMGSDEFIMAFKTEQNIKDILVIAGDIIKNCNEPIYFEQCMFNFTLSIGISQNSDVVVDSLTLIKNADMAMRKAKTLGSNQFYVFSIDLSKIVSRKNHLELLMRQADLNEEFQLYYQPQIEISTGRVIGAEALLRWKNCEVGMVSPDEFIPIMEETGVIVPMGHWVINRAMEQASYWNRKYNTNFKIGINISPIQLKNSDFFKYFKIAMEKYSISSDWIDVEITESVAMGGEMVLNEIFNAITGLGITISIDDFGTGYSSLSYLKNYSFDRLKIAKSLVNNINTNHNDIQILKAITMMAKALGIRTIAEGVENEEQFNILKEIECNQIQGYYFGRPMPAHDFEEKYFLKVSEVEIKF